MLLSPFHTGLTAWLGKRRAHAGHLPGLRRTQGTALLSRDSLIGSFVLGRHGPGFFVGLSVVFLKNPLAFLIGAIWPSQWLAEMIVRDEIGAHGLDARLFPIDRLAAQALKLAKFKTMTAGGWYRTELYQTAQTFGWTAAAIASGISSWSAADIRRGAEQGHPDPTWEILANHDPRRFAIEELEKTQLANSQLLMARARN